MRQSRWALLIIATALSGACAGGEAGTPAAAVAAMYLGKIVESGTAEDLYGSPQHPYTKALLSAVPRPDPKAARTRQRIMLSGDVSSSMNPPPWCPFHPRCPHPGKG